MPGHEKSVSTTVAPETTNPSADRRERDHRQDRVSRRPAEHAVTGKADRAGGRHEVLTHHVGQRRAHDHHVLPDDPDRERDDRQRRVLGDVPHVAERRERRPGLRLLARREEADLHGEEPDQDHARPEVRHRVEEERRLHHAGVARRAAVGGRVDAEPRPDERREQGGDARPGSACSGAPPTSSSRPARWSGSSCRSRRGACRRCRSETASGSPGRARADGSAARGRPRSAAGCRGSGRSSGCRRCGKGRS